ncbi:g7281 [Coccomyxa elongata]
MCDTYDNLTGICLSDASAEESSTDRHADLTSVNDVLTDDIFAQIIQQCSTARRAQMATVCKLWNSWIERGWTTVTLQDPHLAKQLTWLRRVNKNALKELVIYGSRYPIGGVPIVQSLVLSCISRFAGLRRIELDPEGRFLVSPSFLGHLSVIKTLDSLKASCTVAESNEAATLIELAVLTSLKELDLSFPQQQTRINLAGEFSALSQLTNLRVQGVRSLQQQGGPSAEALLGITMLTRLTLGLGFRLQPSDKVRPAALRALQYCSTLSFLDIIDYDCGLDDTLEVFSLLTSLKELRLGFTTHSKRYSLSPELSRLQKLEILQLSARPPHQYLGGLEHLPSLSSATVSGSHRGALLQSSSLVRLEIRGLEGHGFELEEVLQIGKCPRLASLTLSDAVEVEETRFMCLDSLSSLQELVVHLAYTTVSCPISTYQPADGTDVTRLSALLHALPALRVVEIQAMRRDVLLERMGQYEHLSLACADICIPPCEAAAVARLKSLHLVFETGHPETVDMLAQLGASHKVFSAGDLYMCKELQDIRLGCARARMSAESQLRIRNLTEHAHDYQEKVAAVHQSQHLLLGTIRDLLEGLQAALQSAKGIDDLACIEKIEKLHTRARRCTEVLAVLEARLERIRGALRDLWRQARTYGDEELAQLKASAEDLKSQVDFLMEAQKKRRQQEEILTLRELRRTVDALRAESEALEDQKRAVVEAMDEVASNVEGEMAVQAEAQAQERVADILKELDSDGLLEGATMGKSTQPKQQQPDTNRRQATQTQHEAET